MKKLDDADITSFLNVGNRESNGHPGDPITKGRIKVTLDNVQPYDKNPRQTPNPRFDEILASIEARGLDHPPDVTRREPTDAHYIIADGGKTRLEILHILFEKYTALAKESQDDDERLRLLEKAQSFYAFECIFKPWVSESHALAGHMSENESRGSTLFIERALAIGEFRTEYRKEDRARAEARGEIFEDKPLTIRALAERITAQGWTVSNSHLSRFEYAANLLLPVVPTALWAGAGSPLIRNIRSLEKAYSTFWSETDSGRDNPQRLLDLFFGTLAEYDGESVDLDGFTRQLNDELGQMLDLPAMTVGAEIGALMAGVTRTPVPSSVSHISPSPLLPSSGSAEAGKTSDNANAGANAVSTVSSGKEKTHSPAKPPSPAPSPDSLPDTPEGIQKRIIESIVPLMAKYRLDMNPIILGKGVKGCHWFVINPINIVTGTDFPTPDVDDNRAIVWWSLFRLSRTYRQVPDLQHTFMEAFARYSEARMSMLEIVMLLWDQEDRLPKKDKTHLASIQKLVQHGDELIQIQTTKLDEHD